MMVTRRITVQHCIDFNATFVIRKEVVMIKYVADVIFYRLIISVKV